MRNEENFEVLEGTVENIIYCNQANGYTVCNVVLKDGTDMAVVGCLPAIAEGEMVKFTGKFVIHPDYGEQFKAESYERIMPREISDILRYLSSGIIKGVGPATAKKITNRFGLETLEIIADYPARLSEISISLLRSISPASTSLTVFMIVIPVILSPASIDD
jgi:exodeoxyribonuclease V alpha subunit